MFVFTDFLRTEVGLNNGGGHMGLTDGLRVYKGVGDLTT